MTGSPPHAGDTHSPDGPATGAASAPGAARNRGTFLGTGNRTTGGPRPAGGPDAAGRRGEPRNTPPGTWPPPAEPNANAGASASYPEHPHTGDATPQPPDAGHEPAETVVPRPLETAATRPGSEEGDHDGGAGRTAVPNPAPAGDDEPFWLPAEPVAGDAGAWPAPRMRVGQPPSVHRSAVATGPTPRSRETRRAGPALVSLVVLSLLAAFFAWVSAEPLWLAVGHGDRGTATVRECTGSGVGQRCVADFRAAGFAAPRVALVGAPEADRRPGSAVAARMVGADSRQAYASADGPTLHLRWGLGLLLVLLCGAGIAWATGAGRLACRRARRQALIGSLAGPLLLAVGFLAAAW
ncbi:MAG TPA: hypothetical protein VES42_15385 [Pilimelia sp.]|nr:hypothetical protein [Pilimelia sp.]